MKILITGFEPFGGQEINPSQEVLKILPDKMQHVCSGSEIEIVTLSIPTVFGRSMEILREAIDRHQPDAVLSIGQAGGRSDITVEMVGTNEADFPIPDNDGNMPQGQVIVEGGADAYFTTIPNKRIVQSILAAGIPASISRSAGTFLCNYVCYGVCDYIRIRYPDMRSGFMHIPYLPSQVAKLYLEGKAGKNPSMSLADIEVAVKQAVLAIFNCVIPEGEIVTGSTH